MKTGENSIGSHTPGPWIWVDGCDGAYLVPAAEYSKDPTYPSCYAIASDGSACGEYSQKIDPHGANATLIAAAPDLLYVAQGLVDLGIDERFIAESWPELAKVLAGAKLATSKARGES